LDGKFDTTKKAEQSSFSGDKCVAANSGNPDPKQKHCTFVSTHGEFTEQHWYNCYTCGLTWDKGCCSLCARVCHKGHDVGYSRKSSFFCDCGAEVKTNAGRISCKCLSPLTPSALALASDKDGQANHAISGNNCPEQSDGNFWNEAISITATHFRETARNSLQDFVKSIDASLIGDLFDTFNAQFDLWANEESMHSFLSSTSKENSTRENAEESRNELSILSRDGVHLEIEKLGTPSFSPLRMSRTNAINSKISTDLSISKSKKTLLTKNAVERGIVTTDSRGRLIVAEPKALLFCGALSLVNTRHASHCLESGLLRSQLCVLGTHKVDFGVVGVSVCPGRDRHLVTWGFTSARFLILTETCDKVDLSVNLMTGLETSDCDSNYIVKVEWVTGVSTPTNLLSLKNTIITKFRLTSEFIASRLSWQFSAPRQLSCTISKIMLQKWLEK
jgi:E3 ubiquitin-protein ligase UBR4